MPYKMPDLNATFHRNPSGITQVCTDARESTAMPVKPEQHEALAPAEHLL